MARWKRAPRNDYNFCTKGLRPWPNSPSFCRPPAAAAGFSDKNYKKPFAPLANQAVWLHSAERFLNRNDVVQMILVISPEDREDFNFKFASNVAILGIEVVDGGAERADSVPGGPGPGQAGGRFRLRPRRRPAVPGRRLDRQDLRGRREDRRGDLRHSGGRHAQARRRGQHDRGDRLPRRPVGGPDAAGLSPRAAAGGLRQARRLPGHRRRPTGRAARASR